MCLLNRNRPSLASISSSSTQQRSNAGDSPSRFIKRPLTVLRQPFIFIVVQRWWGSRETARSTWPTLRTRPPRTLKTGYVSGATQSQQWRLALTSSFSSTPPQQLFVKRYCRTKHGTYVPTLREHFRPRLARRDLLWTGGKRR